MSDAHLAVDHEIRRRLRAAGKMLIMILGGAGLGIGSTAALSSGVAVEPTVESAPVESAQPMVKICEPIECELAACELAADRYGRSVEESRRAVDYVNVIADACGLEPGSLKHVTPAKEPKQ